MFRLVVHVDVKKELQALPPIVQAKMIRQLDKLRQNPTALREPDSKPLLCRTGRKPRWQLPVTLAFYLHSLDEPLLFSSRRFKQTADLGTSDQVAATAERKN